MGRRAYDNSVRLEAATQTRRRIIEAAIDLLGGGGYRALSVAAVARAADVSPQTIYNSVGNKGDLLKACYDVVLAGDDDAVAMSDRPEFQALAAASSADEFVARYAAWSRLLSSRVASIVGPLVRSGSEGDAGAATFVATIEGERRIGSTHAMTRFRDAFGLPDGVSLERAIDACWTLNAPELYDRLTARCGWTDDEYEAWLAGQLRAALVRGG